MEDSSTVHRRSRSPSLHKDDEKYEWNALQEENAINWANTAQCYGVIHNRSGKYYMKMHKYLGIPAIVLAGIVGTAEFASLAGDECNRTWLNVFGGVLSLLAVAFGLAYNQLEFDKRAFKHFHVSHEYEALYYFMVDSVAYDREHRLNVRAFFRNTRERLKSLKDISPDPPDHILDKYIQDLDKVLVPFQIKVQNSEVVIPIDCTNNNLDRSQNVQALHLSDNHISENNPDEPLEPSLPEEETDLQDEFAAAMQKKMEERKEKIEQFQLSRLETNLDTLHKPFTP